MLRLGCLLVIVVVAAVSVAIIKFLPWWGAILAFAGIGALLLYVVPKLLSRSIGKFGMALFETKSKVLRDAGVTVHAVEWTAKPEQAGDDDDDEDEDDEEDELGKLSYLLVEATFSPGRGDGGPMQHYEPAEMLLVPHDKPVSAKSLTDDSDEGPEAHAADLHFVLSDGGTTDEWDKVSGEQRVRFVFAVPEGLSGRVKFQYYFEGIGDMMIPQDRPAPE